MKIFTCLDFLGTKPSLLINNQNSCKSNLGGVLSICVSVCLFIGVLYFLNILFFRLNYVISQSEEYFPNSYSDWDNLEASIILLDKLGLEFEDQDRIYGVTAMLYNYVPVFNKDNSTSMEFKFKPVALEKCQKEKSFLGDEKLWDTEKYIEKSWCTVQGQNLNISKPFGYENYTTMMFWVHRCINSTKKNDCLPSDIIENKLMNANLAIRFKNYYFDHKQQNDIGIPYVMGDVPAASSTIYKRLRYTMKQVEYETDDGVLLPTSNIQNYLIFDGFRETVDFRKDPVIPGSMMTISFDMHILKQKIKKSYYKLQNMLADLGGLFKAVIAVTTLLNSYFCNKIYYNSIIEDNIESLVEAKTISRNLSKAKNLKINFDPGQHGVSHFVNSQQMINLNISKSNIVIFKNKEETIKNKIVSSSNNLSNKKEDKSKMYEEGCYKLNLLQMILPVAFFSNSSKNKKFLIMHYRLRSLIDRQFDVINLFKKLNSVDKISLMLTGEENREVINNCINPLFYQGLGQNSKSFQISQNNKFIEARNIIFDRITNYVMNPEETPMA
jgi:hypothetical protein